MPICTVPGLREITPSRKNYCEIPQKKKWNQVTYKFDPFY